MWIQLAYLDGKNAALRSLNNNKISRKIPNKYLPMAFRPLATIIYINNPPLFFLSPSFPIPCTPPLRISYAHLCPRQCQTNRVYRCLHPPLGSLAVTATRPSISCRTFLDTPPLYFKVKRNRGPRFRPMSPQRCAISPIYQLPRIRS